MGNMILLLPEGHGWGGRDHVRMAFPTELAVKEGFHLKSLRVP